MDTTGNFKIAIEMAKNNLFTTIAKHVTVEEWTEFAAKHPETIEVGVVLLCFKIPRQESLSCFIFLFV